MWYIIFLGLGIYLLNKGVKSLKASLAFLRSSKISLGKVVEIKTVFDRKGRSLYQPVFVFKSSSHEEIPFHFPGSGVPSPYNIGEEALIAYQVNNPTNARLYTYYGIFQYAILMFAAAFPLILISIGYFVFLIVE